MVGCLWLIVFWKTWPSLIAQLLSYKKILLMNICVSGRPLGSCQVGFSGYMRFVGLIVEGKSWYNKRHDYLVSLWALSYIWIISYLLVFGVLIWQTGLMFIIQIHSYLLDSNDNENLLSKFPYIPPFFRNFFCNIMI